MTTTDQAAAAEEAVLYVLAAPEPGSGVPAYLIHQVGGVGCVLAYTDLDRLAECCGQHQPWLGIKIGALMADLRDQQLPGPVVNLPVSPAAWWTAAGPPWRIPSLATGNAVPAAGEVAAGGRPS